MNLPLCCQFFFIFLFFFSLDIVILCGLLLVCQIHQFQFEFRFRLFLFWKLLIFFSKMVFCSIHSPFNENDFWIIFMHMEFHLHHIKVKYCATAPQNMRTYQIQLLHKWISIKLDPVRVFVFYLPYSSSSSFFSPLFYQFVLLFFLLHFHTHIRHCRFWSRGEFTLQQQNMICIVFRNIFNYMRVPIFLL